MERWVSIDGFEGSYEVSDRGQVRGVDRVACGKVQLRATKGQLFKPQRDHVTDYLFVLLRRAGFAKRCSIHRLVAKAFIPNPQNLPEVDHRDLDKHNNWASNLRWATNLQNRANIGINRNNTSGYRGVTYNKHARKWRATLRINGDCRHLGYFVSAKDAAIAYDTAARLCGEFARLNSP